MRTMDGKAWEGTAALALALGDVNHGWQALGRDCSVGTGTWR